MNKRIQAYFLFLIVALLLSACNLQLVEGPQGGEDVSLLQTITAQALILEQAGQTATPIAAAAPNQVIVYITATADGAASATPEAVIPAAVLPPATGPVTVTVSVATNCRSGPGQSFANLYGMPVGQVAKVIAKNSYAGYWIIEIPGQNGKNCWLWGQYASVSGDTASLKDVVTPTSAATLKPTATVTPKTTVTPTATNTSSAVAGCTDSNATNYNPAANTNDGSCKYSTNAPTITNASVSCVDQLDGNYKFNFTIDWLKNNTRSGLEYRITYEWKLADSTSMSYEEVPVSTSPVIFSVIKPGGWKLEIDFIIVDTLGLTIGARSDAVQLTCP